MTDDLKKKMDDLESTRGSNREADVSYEQARSDWQASEENWRKIEQGEKILEDPKPEPKSKKKKPKPKSDGLLPFPEEEGGGGE